MRVILLALVNGVDGDEGVDGNKVWDIGKTVVNDAEQCEFMPAKLEFAKAVQLVLLAVFEPVEIAIP